MQLVIAIAAVYLVIAAATKKMICAIGIRVSIRDGNWPIAPQDIITIVAIDKIISRAPGNIIIAVATKNMIITEIAQDNIIAFVAINPVVAVTAVKIVIAGATTNTINTGNNIGISP